ncbi:hypothetical protein [Streptomyces sp. NPDC059168]|uniref:hypothetical protein n=1 Tax=Streptomyces sp. NPDC059168 TaxID=3346753 RepID=UPI003686459D
MNRMSRCITAAAVTGAAALGGLLPGTAAAAPQAVCAPNYLHYKYYTSSGTIADWSRHCEGSYSLNSGGYSIRAGEWSGYVYFKDGTSSNFCQGETRYLGGRRVIRIYMVHDTVEPCL